MIFKVILFLLFSQKVFADYSQLDLSFIADFRLNHLVHFKANSEEIENKNINSNNQNSTVETTDIKEEKTNNITKQSDVSTTASYSIAQEQSSNNNTQKSTEKTEQLKTFSTTDEKNKSKSTDQGSSVQKTEELVSITDIKPLNIEEAIFQYIENLFSRPKEDYKIKLYEKLSKLEEEHIKEALQENCDITINIQYDYNVTGNASKEDMLNKEQID